MGHRQFSPAKISSHHRKVSIQISIRFLAKEYYSVNQIQNSSRWMAMLKIVDVKPFKEKNLGREAVWKIK